MEEIMKRLNLSFIATLALLVAAGGCRTGGASDPKTNLASVDPLIGGVGLILQPTRPTVHLPNSLVRSYPVKTDQLDDQIQYFPLAPFGTGLVLS